MAIAHRVGAFAGVVTPFMLEPYTGNAMVFFGTIMAIVAVGACIPVLFGKETVGQLELVTEPNAGRSPRGALEPA